MKHAIVERYVPQILARVTVLVSCKEQQNILMYQCFIRPQSGRVVGQV